MNPDHQRTHGTDSLLFRDMFGSPEARAIYSDTALIQRWLDVEAALAEAEAGAGLIPHTAAAAIRSACKLEHVDLQSLAKGTELVGYPILSLVRQIEKAAGPEAGGYVHWGATTQDIMDTATALQARDARILIATELLDATQKFEALARKHRNTVMAGRTHGQQALPITFGYKIAVYVAELRRHQARFSAVASRMEFVEFAGAAGTLASIGPAGLDVQRRMAGILGLRMPPIAWHTSRDGLAEFVCVQGLLAATLAKFAQEISLLQRTEIGEVEEGFVHGRGGSSTMPQKRNPIASEAIIGASRLVRQMAPAMFDAMLHDNERATGPWHAEWLALPESTVLMHGMLRKTHEILDGLVVRPERMRQNLDLTRGLINSEAVMMALAKHLGRQEAHEVVYKASMSAVEHGRSLREELLSQPAITGRISPAEIDQMLNPENYLGLAASFVDRVLSETEGQ